MMRRVEWTFTGEVIEWRGPAPYFFVAMTPEESEDPSRTSVPGISDSSLAHPGHEEPGDGSQK
jgi:hypothetical protein